MLAIIGGTGVDLRGADSPLTNAREEVVHTRHGAALVTLGSFSGCDIVFLHRHTNPEAAPGPASHVPPHCINYRANIAALKKLGVTAILASTAVGGMRREWPPGTLVLLDQFVDTTSGRHKTFFDVGAVHVDVTTPYCLALRGLLLGSSAQLGLELKDGGTYVCCDGPRFETPAEIRVYSQWGDVVGMTGVPEVVLAREAGISYAGVSIVTNFAAGISELPLTQAEVVETMCHSLPKVVDLFLHAALNYRSDAALPSRNATLEFSSAHYDPNSFII